MQFNRNQKLALAALIGFAVIGFGLWGRANSSRLQAGSVLQAPAAHEEQPDGDMEITDLGRTGPAKVVVHVAGEVANPGVYTLPGNSRVIDAIKRAGGPTESADANALNLAALAKDGDKIIVPSRVQTQAQIPFIPQGSTSAPLPQTQTRASSPSLAPSSQPAAKSATGKLKTPGEGVVNINSADLTELQRLPGVGPSTAQKILDYRMQIGRFSLPDQLMDVKGIGPKKYEKMRPFVTL